MGNIFATIGQDLGLEKASHHSSHHHKGGRKKRKTARKHKKRRHPHKHQKSKTRKGRLDFVTHKGDKAYNARSHRQYKKKRPYTKHRR